MISKDFQMTRALALLALVFGCVACDDDGSAATPDAGVAPQPEAEPAPQPAAEPEPQADFACEEVDFGGTGWGGQAVVDGALALEAGVTYRVSTTVLYLRPGAEAFETFNEKLGPIIGELGTTDGLLAFNFGASDRCGTQRTVTVWRDVDSMYRFVGSPSHVAAMGISSAVGFAAVTDSWDSAGDAIPQDWSDYRARLLE